MRKKKYQDNKTNITNTMGTRKKEDIVQSEEYPDCGLDKLDDCDTLIASLWYGLNYGSILSAYALYKVVEKLGRKPVLLNKPKALWTTHYDNPEGIAGRLMHRYCKVAKREIAVEEFQKCDMFLAGPDVLWNYELCGKETGDFFFGGCVEPEVTKISCASSFGKVQGNSSEQMELLKARKQLSSFQGVSVRNGYDAGICQQQFQCEAEIILDPVFLCEMSAYEELIKNAHFDAKEPYIFTYIEHGNEQMKKYIEAGMQIKNLESRNYIDINRFPESSKELGLDVTFHVMADDWLCSIWNSDYVVTDSYYGVCFAILFHKPFSVLVPSDFKRKNEFRELLSWFELEERMVPCDEKTDLRDYFYLYRKEIRYARADRKLQKLQDESMRWLEEHIAK